MKNIILFSLLFVSGLSFGQQITASIKPASVDEKIVWTKDELNDQIKKITQEDRKAFLRVEEDYDTAYFALYIQVQTSHITDDLLKYTQKVSKFGQKNRMTVYIGIQSGKPGNGCPPGGCH